MKYFRLVCLCIILFGVCRDSYIYVGAYTNCGGHLNSATGIITSPNYPGSYPLNTVCEWVIEEPNKHRMVIKFETMELEGNCAYDCLEIRDGGSASSPLVGQYFGKILPANIVSSGYQIYLKFKTDSSNNYQGFRLAWGRALSGCDIPSMNEEIEANDGSTDLYERVNAYTNCGGHKNSSTGIITSPNYPADYPINAVCEWVIEEPNKHQMVIKFATMAMEGNCALDCLEIRDGGSASSPLVGKYAGSSLPANFVSSGYKIYLKFTTNSLSNYQGFKLGWGSVLGDSDIRVGAYRSCGGHLNSSTGIITSPNYPADYPINTVCEWVIEDPNKHRMVINFAAMTIESGCGYDCLEIRDGGSAASPLLGRYSGSSLPANVVSSGYKMYLKFQTDGLTNYPGFKLAWGSALSGSCIFGDAFRIYGGHFHELSGVITSPNYPHQYPNDLDREWIIEAPKHHVVALNVRQFATQPSTPCDKDYLEIRNGSSAETSTLIGNYCGTNITDKITAVGSRIFLRFRSDHSIGYDGFIIEWDSTELDCGGNLTDDRGSILSPNYPEPFSSFGECNWNIRVSAGSIIQLEIFDLKFEGVERCRFDFIEIYEGSDTRGPKLGQYCQTLSHPLYIETTTNVASIWSRSDSPVSSRRFRINYLTLCHNKFSGSDGVIESPNFPDAYPGQQNCTWIIEAPVGRALKLTFSQFDLDGRFENPCNTDYLEIAEGEDDTPYTKFGKFCNARVPPRMIESTQRQVFLTFHSNNINSAAGFRLEWAVVNVPNKTLPTSQSCLLWSPYLTGRDDYTFTLGSSSHKVHTEEVTWNEARITCEEEGGHLAIINSIAELDAIMNLLNNSDAVTAESKYSIGFHDLYSEGQFVTIHGQSLGQAGFSEWEDGRPDNNKSSEDCGALSINGKLNDVSCETEHGFICEKPVNNRTSFFGNSWNEFVLA